MRSEPRKLFTQVAEEKAGGWERAIPQIGNTQYTS